MSNAQTCVGPLTTNGEGESATVIGNTFGAPAQPKEFVSTTEIFLAGPAVENCNRTKKLGEFVPPPPKIANAKR